MCDWGCVRPNRTDELLTQRLEHVAGIPSFAVVTVCLLFEKVLLCVQTQVGQFLATVAIFFWVHEQFPRPRSPLEAHVSPEWTLKSTPRLT
jgi:hypothetical protein